MNWKLEIILSLLSIQIMKIHFLNVDLGQFRSMLLLNVHLVLLDYFPFALTAENLSL